MLLSIVYKGYGFIKVQIQNLVWKKRSMDMVSNKEYVLIPAHAFSAYNQGFPPFQS